ncbi:hypothetical protein MRX96_018152 [Rhipicephalus microplus]
MYLSSSGSSTSVGSASVPGSPTPSPAASPAPTEQPSRDAGGTSSPTPHIGVPTPAGVPVDSPILGSPRSPDPASSPRPSSSARQVLVPYDFGPSSSSNGASPATRGSSAASPVGDAAFLLDDDDTISYDVAVSSPPLDAGSSPVVLPGSPVSPASSPSPPASVDEAAADPDEVPEHPENDSTTLPDATGPHAPPRGPGTPAPLLAAGPAHRRVMGPMRGSMDAGRRLGCRGGASPTGASWSPTPPARPNERGRHTAAVPPQPSTRGTADPGGNTPDLRHPAARPTRPLGAHVVGPPGRLHPSSRTRSGSGGRRHIELFDRRGMALEDAYATATARLGWEVTRFELE